MRYVTLMTGWIRSISVAGLAVLAVAVGMESAIAGRPLIVDDADPVEPGLWEFECGVGDEEDGSARETSLSAGLAHGIVSNVEASVGAGALRLDEDEADESGFGDVGLALKWRFLSTEAGHRQAVVPSVKLPTADESKGLGSGETDLDLAWVRSTAIGESVGVHVTAGYTWVGESGAGDVVHYGLSMDCMLCDRLQWVCEVYAEDERDAGEDTLALLNAGFRWMPTENSTWDIAGGAPVDGDGPDYFVTAGFTHWFGTIR